MPMTAVRRCLRYFALALATTQIVAFTVAPVLESALAVSRAGTVLAVDRNAPERSAPVHDPSTCVVCQIISAVVLPPQPPTILVPSDQATGRVSVATDAPRQSVRLPGVLSRAPPTIRV
jgi:hypothetical protein